MTPNFTIGSIIGLPGVVLLTDTSTDPDVLVTSRRVFLITDAQTYLVPSGTTTNYTIWDIANATAQIDALDKDYGLSVVVEWLDVSNAVLYAKTIIANFDNYNSAFEYSLVYAESNGSASLNSPNRLTSRMQLRLAIDGGNIAINKGSNITMAQASDDRGTFLSENINLFY